MGRPIWVLLRIGQRVSRWPDSQMRRARSSCNHIDQNTYPFFSPPAYLNKALRKKGQQTGPDRFTLSLSQILNYYLKSITTRNTHWYGEFIDFCMDKLQSTGYSTLIDFIKPSDTLPQWTLSRVLFVATIGLSKKASKDVKLPYELLSLGRGDQGSTLAMPPKCGS